MSNVDMKHAFVVMFDNCINENANMLGQHSPKAHLFLVKTFSYQFELRFTEGNKLPTLEVA